MVPGIKQEMDTTPAEEMENEDFVITTLAVTRETEMVARVRGYFDSKKIVVVNSMSIEHPIPTSE